MLHSRLVLLFIYFLFVIWTSLHCTRSHLESIYESSAGSLRLWRSIPQVHPSSDGSALSGSLLVFFFLFHPLFFFGEGSAWDTLLFISFVFPLNLTDLPRFFCRRSRLLCGDYVQHTFWNIP